MLSITNIPAVVKEGISLGVGLDKSGSPKLLLNTEAAIREGRSWKRPIIKMAKIVN